MILSKRYTSSWTEDWLHHENMDLFSDTVIVLDSAPSEVSELSHDMISDRFTWQQDSKEQSQTYSAAGAADS